MRTPVLSSILRHFATGIPPKKNAIRLPQGGNKGIYHEGHEGIEVYKTQTFCPSLRSGQRVKE
jgi:hypothetical protein